MRIKITNAKDELLGGAEVVDADTGEKIAGVIDVTLTMTPGKTIAQLIVLNPAVDIILEEGEITIETTQ